MTDAHHIDRTASTGKDPREFSAAGEPFRLALSDAQIEEVLRGADGADGGGLHGFLLARAGRTDQLSMARSEELASEEKLSLSVLRAFAILQFLSFEGEERPVSDIAWGVEGTTSTTHRYLTTLKKIGLIDQLDVSRKYLLATAPDKKTRGAPQVGKFPRLALSLCDEQVEQVLRAVVQEKREGRHGLRGFLVGRAGRLEQLGPLRDKDLPDDPGISRSLLRGLLIVRFLFLAGAVQPLYAIAPGVGLSPATTHRYLATLKHVRLVEQVEATHKYRLATDTNT
jgi:hypothetical protein